MVTKEDFFTPKNEVHDITEDDYKDVASIVKTIESIACTSYHSIYVIDYNRHNFLYVSNNPLFLCGRSPEEACKLGQGFYLKHVPESEHQFLITVNRVGFEFFDKIPQKDRMDYVISYEFHLKTKSNPILVNHKLKPLKLDKYGHVWLAVCVVSLSSHKEAGHILMQRLGTSQQWQYSLAEGRWLEMSPIQLSETSKEILILSAQGYTMDQISSKMGISINTIKFHKKRIFETLDVESITEALTSAINSKLI